MTLPDFICIGAQKAGTTWLYEMLAQNPSIWLPPLKEVHFFDNLGADEKTAAGRRDHLEKLALKLESGRLFKGSKGGGKADFVRSLAGPDMLSEAWYQRIFAHPDATGRTKGEITPAYLALEEETIAYAARLLPAGRFILIVREPKARFLSQLKMNVGRMKLDVLGEDEWKQVLRRTRQAARGDYASAIPAWQRIVGRERLLILPFSMVRHEPLALLRQIEDFIGAKPLATYRALDEQVHKTKEVAVPDWVVERVDKLVKPQVDYLVDTFGAEFYQKTR